MTTRKIKFCAWLLGVLIATGAANARPFSASHFGFGVENNPLYGMSGVGGSMFILDWGKTVGKRFSWGLKTIANGAHGKDMSLFRLSSGPAVHYRWQSFEVHYSVGYFQESLQHQHNSALTASTTGFNQTIALQRYVAVQDIVEIGWGSYLSLAYGTLRPDFRVTPVQSLRWGNKQRFTSRNNGVYASLRVSL